MNAKKIVALLVALLMVSLTNVEAIILIGTGDPTANTTAPEGDRGWSHVGVLRARPYAPTTATVIGRRYVLTTDHIVGLFGYQADLFEFVHNGKTNYISEMYKDPNSELVILKMTKTFSAWAELYDDTNSLVGKTFTVFGMGGQRGEQVTTQIENETPFVITNYVVGADSVQFKIVGANSGTQFVIEQSTNLVTWTTLPDVHTASENGCDVTIAKIEAQQVFTRATALPTTITNGWLVGDVDEKIRWGENLVDRVASYSNGEDQLVSSFTNPGVSTNECMLSSYDSGGGVFIKDTTGTWKLAGVNYASFSKYWWYQGLITEATLFDLRGMQYTSGTTTGSGTTASSGTLPSIYSSSYHTSTVNRVGWIRSIINP